MIVVPEERGFAHQATGVWGRVTLDQVLRKTAVGAPDRLALADFADRDGWTGGPAERLSYRALDARVEALAAFFAGLGLKPDTVVGCQLPPIADSVAILFGLLRAGLIAAPLPLALREAETRAALDGLGARAVVTVAETAGEAHGERMRQVAGDLFQIRFLFGAGPDLPDGIIPLQRVYAEMDTLGPAPVLARKGNAADHCATLSWLPAGPDHAPVPRSHNHWIATGLMTLLEARVETGATIVSPFAPSGLVGFGAAVMPWLLSAGTLVLGLPAAADRIAEEAARHGASHVLAPARFARRVGERLDAHKAGDATIVSVTLDRDPDAIFPRGTRAVDVVALGERALLARRRRDPALPGPLPLGPVGAPADAGIAPTLVETRLQPGAEGEPAALAVRGAMVPDAAWPRADRKGARDPAPPADGWVATGLLAEPDPARPNALRIVGRAGETGGAGALAVDLAELDRLYRDAGDLLDAAAILVGDGERLAAAVVPRPGSAFDEAGFRAGLDRLGLGLHRLPETVVAVPAIARTPSGRVLRRGLAAHLDAAAEPGR